MDAGDWLAHLLVAFAPTTSVEGINWVYWTLTCEIAFYAVIGLCVWRRRLAWPILIGLTAVACVAGGHLPAVAFPLRYWSFFALGVAIAEQRRRPGSAPLLLTLLCVVDLLSRQGRAESLTGAVTALSVAACLAPWGAFLNRERVFSWIGRSSYSLYLIHVPIGVWLGLSLARGLFGASFRQSSLVAHGAGDLGLLLLASSAAFLFYRLVERPSIAMMARLPLGTRPELRLGGPIAS
jgi:peptidoglycan/LPS O-acetylase OafA/YrhL